MWDFITSRPETIHQVLRIFSDQGTPDGFRHINGFGANTYKMVNAAGNAVYVKFHYLVSWTPFVIFSILSFKKLFYILKLTVKPTEDLQESSVLPAKCWNINSN